MQHTINLAYFLCRGAAYLIKSSANQGGELSCFCSIGGSMALLLRSKTADNGSTPRFLSGETARHRGFNKIPFGEESLCRGIARFPLCQMTLRRGKACFPPCELFIAWVMEEFPCRKLIRDGYGTHCLPAISFEIFTDGFLYIAIYLEKFTEQIATSTKSFVKLTKEIATLQSGL